MYSGIKITHAMTLQHAETIHSVLQNPVVLITFFSVLLNSKLALNVLS
jgi:hypothetical protein